MSDEVQPVTEDLDAFTNEFFGRNTEPKQEPQTSDEPDEVKEETEQEEVAEVETESVDDGEVEEDEPEEEAPKPKPTVQDRINELVRQREEAKREGQAQLDALRKEFEERFAALTSKPVPEAVKEPDEPTPDDLKEDGTNKYELGEFDPQYIRDLTRYTLNAERQKAEALAAEQAQTTEAQKAQEILVQSWNEKVETAKVEYTDFVEKGQALLNGFNNLPSDYAQYLSTILMSMDKGPDVLYYLSNNPAEATTIVNSGAQKATLALGRIEAKFLEAEATKVLQKPKTSKAPAPPPAQARSRGSNGAFVSVPPDTEDLDAFAKEFFVKKK